jgi:L-ribulose-5-phosphate 3-epimerase
MIKLSMHTMATPALTIDQSIELAGKLGFDAIEIVSDERYACGITNATPDGELKRLGALAASNGIEVVGMVPYFQGINSLDANERRESIDGMKRAVDAAVELTAGAVRIYAGKEVTAETFRAQFDHMVASIQAIDAHAAGKVRLNVENHNGTMALSGRLTRDIVDAVNSDNVGIIYDPANLWRLGQTNLAAEYDVQRDKIRHVHFKDAVANYDGSKPPVPAGTGMVPWAEVIAALVGDGYDGAITVEYEKRWHPQRLPDPEIGLPNELKFIRGCIERAKK